MININVGETTEVTFYLQPSLSTPVYLLSAKNETTYARESFIATELSSDSELLQFNVEEVGEGGVALPLTGSIRLKPEGEWVLEVYEQTSSTNLDTTAVGTTKLGDDKLLVRDEPTYDAPPLKNAFDAPAFVCMLVIDSISKTEPTAPDAADGTATVNVSGDQGTLSYLWSDSLAQTTNPATGLEDGTYTVIVTDDIVGSCNATDSVTLIDPTFVFGNCLSYDGVNDQVDFTPVSINASEDYTTNIWIKPGATDGDVFFSGSTSSFVFMSTATNLLVGHDGTNSNFTLPAFSTSSWSMLTISRISDTVRVYVNGTESITGGLTNSALTVISRLGNYFSGGTEYLGLIDEFAILKGTGATSANHTSLYNTGLGEDFDNVMGSSTVHYALNESGSTTTAADSSGNANNGTLTNFPASGMWVAHV